MAKKPKVGDPVKLDGQDGTIGAFKTLYHAPKSGNDPIKLDMARIDVGSLKVEANVADLCWADEGFWYLPHRVGTHVLMTPDLRNRLFTHPEWIRGRDDLAMKAMAKEG